MSERPHILNRYFDTVIIPRPKHTANDDKSVGICAQIISLLSPDRLLRKCANSCMFSPARIYSCTNYPRQVNCFRAVLPNSVTLSMRQNRLIAAAQQLAITADNSLYTFSRRKLHQYKCSMIHRWIDTWPQHLRHLFYVHQLTNNLASQAYLHFRQQLSCCVTKKVEGFSHLIR